MMRIVKQLLVLVFFATCNVSSSFADTFTFENAGFEFDGPPGWNIGSQVEINKVLESNNVGSDLLNNAIKAGVGRLLIITEKPMIEVTSGVNPGIFVDRHAGQVKDINLGMQNVKKFMIQNMRQWKQIGDFEVKKIGQFDAGLMQYSYQVIGPRNTSVIVEEMLWLVPQDAHYFTISTGFAPEDRARLEPVIKKSVSTLRPVN